jgi:hypothetical protein
MIWYLNKSPKPIYKGGAEEAFNTIPIVLAITKTVVEPMQEPVQADALLSAKTGTAALLTTPLEQTLSSVVQLHNGPMARALHGLLRH